MTIIELIERKRDGGGLDGAEIRWIIEQYTAGAIPDYQMAALLMAIFLRGFNDRELAVWTEAMMHSGDVLDFSDLAMPKVDKHSTGGVGDKISIPLAPIVAACGLAVPMMSGRGLGHTGGTLDKLESIPGFRARLDPDEFKTILERLGLVLAGQSETLVPADRLIYALRDATGTVPSIPLISSSIMSKKLAEDLDGLVLDVKVGRGAFMKHEAGARKLAETMVGIGAARGTKVVAILTDMNQPLGMTVGNALEIHESLDILAGNGPADSTEVVFKLGAEMLMLGGLAATEHEARNAMHSAVETGAAMTRFADVIEAQGGDPQALSDRSMLGVATNTVDLPATSAGFVSQCDALDIGTAAVRLGAGRARKEDDVNPAVGIVIHHKIGAEVDAGESLATIHYDDDSRLEAALPLLEGAWSVTPSAPTPTPLVIGEVR
ncbi:MAG: thymidine phosphorylase [Acidimicrobiia bacterium]|nr:thymidine phosphorylase [Acidimicrobiia bacterium]